MYNFDNQLLSDFAKCEAAGVVKHVLGYSGKGAKIAADIGSAFHTAMEKHFQGYPGQRVLEIFEEEYGKIFPPGIFPEEQRFEKVNLMKILERFVVIRGIDKWPFQVLETEKVKGYPVDDKGEYVFWAKRDMLVRETRSNLILPLDHKTSKKLNEWFSKRFELTSQMSGYCWLTSVEFGQWIAKAYVNGIELAKLPSSLGKCKLHATTYNKCGIEHAVFTLYQFLRTPEQLEKWRQDALIMAKRTEFLAKAYPGIEYLPFVTKTGAFNESCRFCEFAGWCATNWVKEKVEEYCVWEPWEPWREGELIVPGKGRERLMGALSQPEYQAQYASAVATIKEEAQRGVVNNAPVFNPAAVFVGERETKDTLIESVLPTSEHEEILRRAWAKAGVEKR